MDPRTKDAIRQTAVSLELLKQEIASIREDNQEMKRLLRSIKDSVVRKYKK